MRMFGHTFKPMTDDDWDGFAGAEEGTLICYCEDCVLLWKDETLVVVTSDGGEQIWETLSR